MRLSRGVRAFFAGMTGLVIAFLYLPLTMIVVLSFNTATSLSFPPKGVTLKWWHGRPTTTAPATHSGTACRSRSERRWWRSARHAWRRSPSSATGSSGATR